MVYMRKHIINQTLKDKNIKLTGNNFIVPFGNVPKRAIDSTLIINKSNARDKLK